MSQQPDKAAAAAGHDDEDAPPPLPSNAEDAQRVKAMSSMDAAETEGADSGAHVDSEALGKAMADLSVGVKKTAVASTVVKVDPADVTVVMDEFLLTKPKATEVLKRYGGDLGKTLGALVAMEA